MRTESFQTPGETRLDIRLGAGEIRVETAEVEETTVVLEPLRDNESSTAAIENARVELRDRGNGYEIVIDVRDRGRGIFRNAEVLVAVTSPAGTSVETKSGSADVEGRGRFGSVEVETGSGEVEFTEIAGEVNISAASGDVKLSSVGGDAKVNTASGDVLIRSIGGEAKINSASGDVIIREVQGELDVNSASGDVLVREAGSSVGINTASGDQELGSVVSGKVTLKSASGDLKIGIREGTSLWVDARSRSGEVRSELPVSDLPPDGNGPSVELRANTMSGDITVSPGMNPNDPTTGAVAAPAPQRLIRLPGALQERNFRRFWVGETVSLFGDQATLIALPLVGVLVLDASAAQMGYLGAAMLFPNLLFSLHAGAWIDRRGRRRELMIFTALGRAAALAAIPVAYAFGVLTLTQLYVASFLIGTLSVLFYVSYSTLFVSLVPRERYLEASSLLNGSRAFSYVAGPSLGGALVQVFSAPVALVVDALSFIFSALTMHSIHPEEPPTEQAGRGHLKAGMRYIWDSPIVRAKLLSTATINFFNFVFWALFILYATRALGVRPGMLGLVLGAGAIGGVLGSLMTGRLSRRFGVGPVYVAGCVLFPVPLVLVPLAGGGNWTIYACLFLAEFISGFGVMLLDISANAITAALVPDRLRARVAGAYMVVNYGVRPLGALAGGALGTWIGLRPTLWIATVGAIAGVLWLLPSPIPHLRELPEADE